VGKGISIYDKVTSNKNISDIAIPVFKIIINIINNYKIFKSTLINKQSKNL